MLNKFTAFEHNDGRLREIWPSNQDSLLSQFCPFRGETSWAQFLFETDYADDLKENRILDTP